MDLGASAIVFVAAKRFCEGQSYSLGRSTSICTARFGGRTNYLLSGATLTVQMAALYILITA